MVDSKWDTRFMKIAHILKLIENENKSSFMAK